MYSQQHDCHYNKDVYKRQNNDNVLRQRFEISEMTNQHVVRANGKNKPFYAVSYTHLSANVREMGRAKVFDA